MRQSRVRSPCARPTSVQPPPPVAAQRPAYQAGCVCAPDDRMRAGTASDHPGASLLQHSLAGRQRAECRPAFASLLQRRRHRAQRNRQRVVPLADRWRGPAQIVPQRVPVGGGGRLSGAIARKYLRALLPELKTADMKDAIRFCERRPAGEPFVRFSGPRTWAMPRYSAGKVLQWRKSSIRAQKAR
jgi:hypothetical protein